LFASNDTLVPLTMRRVTWAPVAVLIGLVSVNDDPDTLRPTRSTIAVGLHLVSKA
jgi:hypothetical protein